MDNDVEPFFIRNVKHLIKYEMKNEKLVFLIGWVALAAACMFGISLVPLWGQVAILVFYIFVVYFVLLAFG